MAIQLVMSDCGGMAIVHLSVCLTICHTEVYQRPINGRWGL